MDVRRLVLALAKIGASLGMVKGGADYFCPSFPHCGHETSGRADKSTCIFYAPLPILADYNALDCRILYAAIQRFESEVFALGGSLKMTIASTAMHLFRSAFLKRDIPIDKFLNVVARQAYIASRVEVIRRTCDSAGYYDINSSFPWSMTKPQPGRLLSSKAHYIEGERLVLVDAEVSIPETYVPPVPMRVDGRVFFPTGRFRRWFVGEDLELILDAGGAILKVFDAMRFEPFDDMAAYVTIIYEMRRRTTDPFRRLVYKYLMNSLYGKFGEGEEKSGLLVHPRKPPDEEDIVKVYRAGVYQVRKDVDLKHNHVPIAANITASSRAKLTRHMWEATKSGGEIYYLDTDSLTTTADLPVSDQLGDLKREFDIDKGTFLAPKLYRIHPGPKIRAKGFRSLTSEEFDRLAEGDAVSIERMIRIRENLGSGQIKPRERTYVKRTLSHLSPEELDRLGFHGERAIRPKRDMQSDGDSRPWAFEELTKYSEK